MKYFSFLFFSVVILKINAQQNIDVQQYNIKLEVTDANDIIIVSNKIKFTALEKLNSIKLNLASVKRNKGMKVSSILSKNKKLKFSHQQDELEIELDKSLNPSQTEEITINYSGIPEDGFIISNAKGMRTFFTDNWPDRGRKWLASNDIPLDKAQFNFEITAPQKYTVICNGIQTKITHNKTKKTNTTYYSEEQPIATKIVGIAIAEFKSKEYGKHNSSTVTAHIFKNETDEKLNSYDNAIEAIKFFEEKIQAPFAYKKLANIQSKTIFGGMENASAIFYSDQSVHSALKERQALVAHEIAHQWFGNMATEKSYQHIWLSEGFATFLTNEYMRYKYGEEEYLKRLQSDIEKIFRFRAEETTPLVNVYETNYMNLLTPISYEKGAYVLTMLKNKLGADTFWKAVQQYYKTYAGKNADTEDFKKIIEIVSGKKLDEFFKQWVYEADHPTITYRLLSENNIKKIEITQVGNKNFSFPLEIRYSTNDGKTVTETVEINQEKTVFTPKEKLKDKLVLNPNFNCLVNVKL